MTGPAEGAPSPPALRLRLSAITTAPRHAVVEGLTAALGAVGWILDFRQFSNMALAVQFEVPPEGAARLRAALEGLPISLDAASGEALARLERTPAGDLPDTVPGSVNVVFVHSEPDLRIPVPAVPG